MSLSVLLVDDRGVVLEDLAERLFDGLAGPRSALRLTRDELLELVRFAAKNWRAELVAAALGEVDPACECCGERLALHAARPRPCDAPGCRLELGHAGAHVGGGGGAGGEPFEVKVAPFVGDIRVAGGGGGFCTKSTQGEPADRLCGLQTGHAGACSYTRPIVEPRCSDPACPLSCDAECECSDCWEYPPHPPAEGHS